MSRISFAIAFAALLPLAGCNQRQKEVTRHATLEEQLKCAATAAENVVPMPPEQAISYMKLNHYSVRTGVCAGWYVISFNTGVYSSYIDNAVEKSQLGIFKSSQNVMVVCNLAMPNGEKKECQSEIEFDKLAEVYFSDK